MSFEAGSGQGQVLYANDPVLLVLGGAGTGKTTIAAASVRKILDENESTGRQKGRALFLSFSRSAVGQIVDRTSDLLGHQAKCVEITTFHAFAWRLIQRWGSAVGIDEPILMSPSEVKLRDSISGLTFDDLIPLALQIAKIPAIRNHLERRWTVIVSDEFQDTSDPQFELLKMIRGQARLLLLGDLNQCIYSELPGIIGVGPERIAAALALPGSRKIELPDVSHRDSTNILSAAASAIRRREFEHGAVKAAIRTGKLSFLHYDDPDEEGPLVAALIEKLRIEGNTVGVFSHHIDATATLSDHLNSNGIMHDIVGLPEATSSAIQAQAEMLYYSAGHGTFEAVRYALAIFVTSLERGKKVPQLALMIAERQEAPAAFSMRMRALDETLQKTSSVSEAFRVASDIPIRLGLTRGERTWSSAATIFRNSLSPKLFRATTFPQNGLDYLRGRLEAQRVSLLTSDDIGAESEVQLMGLYQCKGREADATIVVLRKGDFYGNEPEPMDNGSRLLYVVLTRARKKTIVLMLGTDLPKLIAPMRLLA